MRGASAVAGDIWASGRAPPRTLCIKAALGTQTQKYPWSTKLMDLSHTRATHAAYRAPWADNSPKLAKICRPVGRLVATGLFFRPKLFCVAPLEPPAGPTQERRRLLAAFHAKTVIREPAKASRTSGGFFDETRTRYNTSGTAPWRARQRYPPKRGCLPGLAH